MGWSEVEIALGAAGARPSISGFQRHKTPIYVFYYIKCVTPIFGDTKNCKMLRRVGRRTEPMEKGERESLYCFELKQKLP